MQELISLNIVPIINTNDAVAPPPQIDEDLVGVSGLPSPARLAPQRYLSVWCMNSLRATVLVTCIHTECASGEHVVANGNIHCPVPKQLMFSCSID